MIQIDIPMPKNCTECFAFYDYICCNILDEGLQGNWEDTRMPGCPLKEVGKEGLEIIHCGECRHKRRLGDFFGSKLVGVELSPEMLNRLYCEPMKRCVEENDYCGFAERIM